MEIQGIMIECNSTCLSASYAILNETVEDQVHSITNVLEGFKISLSKFEAIFSSKHPNFLRDMPNFDNLCIIVQIIMLVSTLNSAHLEIRAEMFVAHAQ